jgi:RNA polymerase sigma factor (sigma-70 family)
MTEALVYPGRDRQLALAVRENWKGIKEFVRSRVRSAEDAEDIVQDVFVQLSVTFDVETPIERISAWLYTVARNRVIDWYRRRRTASLSVDEDREPDMNGAGSLLADDELGPERLFFRKLVSEELEEILNELPAAQREVFVMHEFDGLSFREIARRTGEPVNTLLSRKRYAVLAMRERLRDLYAEMFPNEGVGI